MITLDPLEASRTAIASGTRPAIAVMFDSADVRLVVFRIEPGQAVPPHQNGSSVVLTVLEGDGFISGGIEERACKCGDVVCFAPNELHGMRAVDSAFHLLATIAPRPGAMSQTPTDIQKSD